MSWEIILLLYNILALAKGVLCTGVASDVHCDGSAGLVCGDVCKEDEGSSLNCHCGPHHTDDGGTCVLRTYIIETSSLLVDIYINLISGVVGSTCYGDLNCKGISPIARCVDDKCQAK